MLYQRSLEDQPDQLRFGTKLVMGCIGNCCRHSRVSMKIEVTFELSRHHHPLPCLPQSILAVPTTSDSGIVHSAERRRAMPRYGFRFVNGELVSSDDSGLDLPNDDAARREANLTALDLQDIPGEDWSDGSLRSWMTEVAGLSRFRSDMADVAGYRTRAYDLST